MKTDIRRKVSRIGITMFTTTALMTLACTSLAQQAAPPAAPAQDARAKARAAVLQDRQTIREARRDLRAARREFIASRIRSGDLGLWLRRAGGGLTVSDLANRGAIAQSGLKEGDEIISVNGQPVPTE